MNDAERALRLECLRLALAHGQPQNVPNIVAASETFYGFVTGRDRTSLIEKAKAAFDELAG